ncbi:MAG: LysM peptidoglycan-binding domain-containing protein [Myxococcota bacterium]
MAIVSLAVAWAVAGTASAQLGVAEDSADDAYGGAGGSWVEGSSGGVRLAGRLRAGPVPEAHTVRKGDTLWDITAHYYGNPWEWPRVWSYNPDITNPHWIYPDDRIRLKGEDGEDGDRPGLPTTGEGGVDLRVAQPRGRSTSIKLDDQGYIERDALEAAGVIAGSPEEHMLLSTYDEIYVRFENGGDVRPGEQYTIFREIEDDERLENEEGALVRIMGAVRIRTYDPDERMARAVITEALDPIERGFRVADVPREFHMVPPAPNERNVEAEVVATLRPRSLMADHHIIFVDAGSEQGVKLGNRFFLMQRGDRWRGSLQVSERAMGARKPGAGGDPEDYPPEIVAEGRVVDVQDNSSALLVTRSLNEISLGTRAEMRKGF